VITLLKKALLLSLITIKCYATIEVHPSLPFEIKSLIHFIEGHLNKVNRTDLIEINNTLQKFPLVDDKESIDSQLRNFLKQTFYKWLLLESKTLSKGTTTNYDLITSKYNERDGKTLIAYLRKSIHQDLEQMIINNPNLKKEGMSNQLSIRERKISKLIIPILEKLNMDSSNEVVIKDLALLFQGYLAYLKERLSLYSSILEPKKIQNNVIYFKLVDKATSATDHSKRDTLNLLPKPTNDWDNLKPKNTTNSLDKKGLPIPVNDWILDF
jgi:hypothetical protein